MNSNRRGVTLVLLVALEAASCASLVESRVTACEWLEVAAPTEVQPSGPRVLQDGPIETCGEVGEYRLVRGEYTLEFWNGSGTSSAMFVRARSSTGSVLGLESAHFGAVSSRGAQRAQNTRNQVLRQGEFSVRLRNVVPIETAEPLRFPLVATLRVLDSRGAQVGVEVVTLVERKGTFIHRNGL